MALDDFLWDIVKETVAEEKRQDARAIKWIQETYKAKIDIHANGKIYGSPEVITFHQTERKPLGFGFNPFGRTSDASNVNDSQADVAGMRKAVGVMMEKMQSNWFEPFYTAGARLPWVAMTLQVRKGGIAWMLGLSNAVIARKTIEFPFTYYTFYAKNITVMMPKKLVEPPAYFAN